MNKISKFITVFLAILLAIISYYLFAGWYNIIPWAILVLVIGYFSAEKKDAIFNGALFGYFLFVTYILIGYKGNTDKARIIRFILFAIAFSLIGAVAGIIGALIGNYFKHKLPGKDKK